LFIQNIFKFLSNNLTRKFVNHVMRGSKINFNDRGFNVRLKANVKIEAGYGDAI